MLKHFVGAALAGLITVGATVAQAAEPLVTSDWLRDNLGRDGLVVLDIRTFPEAAGFEDGHVPSAIHADYAKAGWRTTVDGVPGMLPTPEALADLIGGLGIGNDDHVVLVSHGTDASDFGSATRIYWTFKILGHDEVSILNGGYAGWASDAENPVATGVAAKPEPATFTARFRPELLASTADVQAAIADKSAALVDGRPVAQFLGEAKHPDVPSYGTLPGAVNLDNGDLTTNGGGYFVDKATVDALAEKIGLTGDEAQIAFCNSGHWASVAWFALSEIQGAPNVSLYDGSMLEWTKDPARPVVKGEL